jgi:hypothetical protein
MFDLWQSVEDDLHTLEELLNQKLNARELIAVSGARKRLIKFRDQNRPKELIEEPSFEADRKFIEEFFSRYDFPRKGMDEILKALAEDHNQIFTCRVLTGELKSITDTLTEFNERIKASKSPHELARLIDSKRGLYDVLVNKLPKREFNIKYARTSKAVKKYLEETEIPEPVGIKAIKELEQEV